MRHQADHHHPLARRAQRGALAGLGAVALILGSVMVGGVAVAAPTVSNAHHALPPLPGRAVVSPRVAVPTGARVLGAVGAARVVTGAVALEPRDAAALQAFATAVSTPGSPSDGHFLARGAFAARFGPTLATVNAVRTQLRASGLQVTSVSGNNLLVNFSAPAGRVAAAFGTHLVRYHLADGRTAEGTTSALTLPAGIAGSVTAVVGLSDVTRFAPATTGVAGRVRRGAPGHPAATTGPAVAAPTGAAAACSAARTAATVNGGLTDTQIAHAYGADGLYRSGDTAAGQTIAIFELEPFSRSDVAGFDSCYFGPTAARAMLARLSTTAIDGGQQVGPGEGEAALDIEDISALAPSAHIDVYEAPNNDLGAIDDYNAIVDADTARVASTSWGFCEQALEAVNPGSQQLENTIFEQAAAQGQSFFAAAGDAGSSDCSLGTSAVPPYLSVDDPGSQPFVTSVGGLTISDATEPPVEHVWNDGAKFGAGGGGESTTWAQPTWQADSRVSGIHDTAVLTAAAAEAGRPFCQANAAYRVDETGCREVPDVSAQADEFAGAVTVDYEGGWTTFGGTSSSAPLWAAMIATVNASPGCAATGVGFANPSLYEVASIPAEYGASFTDVTSGDNDVFGVTHGLFPATTGYDMASGLGSPQLTASGGGRGLAYYLCTTAATGRPTVTDLSPPEIDSAHDGSFTIHGTGFASGDGADLVAGVQVGTFEVPASAWKVTSPTTVSVTVPTPAALSGNDAGGYFTDGNGTYDVTVTLTGGSTSAPGPGARLIVYGPPASATGPEVDGVGPSGGAESHPTRVVVYGSGLAHATAVSFGGVAVAVTAGDIREAGNEIDVTAPAYTPDTACAAGDTNPTTDVCQVDVAVTTPSGTSPAGRILAPYSGRYVLGGFGIPVAPAGCGCEIAPSSTEFDYLPAPTITSVSDPTSGADGRDYADEHGGTVETINGTGLGILGLEWVDVGAPDLGADDDVDFTYVSGTELRVGLPAIPVTRSVTDVALSVQTLASPNSTDLASPLPPSTVRDVAFAPGPVVTSVRTAAGYRSGPSTGGTELTIRGHGFAAAHRVLFVEQKQGYAFARQYAITVVSNTEVTLRTPADNPSTDDVEVCGATGCSRAVAARDTYVFYPPGQPRVTGASPRSGPVAGGTKVRISGANLGYIQAVYFGSKRARIIAVPSLLDGGSTTLVLVRAPAGTAGTRVDIRVVTLESRVTGYGRSRVSPAATWTYRR